MIQQAATDAGVSAIVLAVDSPGGTVAGIAEAAQTIRDARAVKPVVAFADGRMQSAAYWLASQADAIFATQSGNVGSIGVYAAFLDRSRAAEMQGVKVEVFKSGKHKGMGIPGTTLTDEQRQMMQADVDKIGAEFRAVVRAGRTPRTVADEVMQGQSFSVADALANGLVDGVGTIGQAIRDAARLASIRGRK
jgi:signal peptide peptidase SppA